MNTNISIQELEKFCFQQAYDMGWHTDIVTGEERPVNIGERCMLIVSEITEGFEGARKNLMDDKLPHRKMIEVELADAVIRIFDTAGLLGLDVSGAIIEKLAYNRIREDHQLENRRKENGKQF